MDKVNSYMYKNNNPLNIFTGSLWYLNDPGTRGEQQHKTLEKTKELVTAGRDSLSSNHIRRLVLGIEKEFLIASRKDPPGGSQPGE